METKPKRGVTQFYYNGVLVYFWKIVSYNSYHVCFDAQCTDAGEVVLIEDLTHVNKVRQAINPISDTKKGQDKIYATLRKVYLGNNPICEAKILGCIKIANQIHHRAGRVGKNYIDINTFLAVCPNCHHWIENNVEKSKEFGLSVDRL